MNQYMLSVIHLDNTPPEQAEMDRIGRDVDALNEEIRKAGRWVFGAGLHPTNTATVLRVRDGEVLMTDGPFIETKEFVGGFWIIKAADLDEALEWGRKATRACAVPIEVRPVADGSED